MKNKSKRLIFGLRCLVYGTVAVAVIANVVLLSTTKLWRSGYEGLPLDEVHRRYLTEEGHQRRGARFEHLALTISGESVRGRSFSLSEVRRLSGVARSRSPLWRAGDFGILLRSFWEEGLGR